VPDADPDRFFDAYPRFRDTSKTGPSLERLNARYRVLLHEHRDVLAGATVLDLASHDGRFSFAALQTGAARVVGLEHDVELVQRAEENMAAYGVDPARYDFRVRDLFQPWGDERFDVVFCFGILYHVVDHMALLSSITAAEASTLLVDTKVSAVDGAVIELRTALGASPPPVGASFEGYPTRLAVEVMLASLGWSVEAIDWERFGVDDLGGVSDYADGRRASFVARHRGPSIDPETRDLAIRLVFENQKEPRWQWKAVKGIAEHFGIDPQALRFWVHQAELAGTHGAPTG